MNLKKARKMTKDYENQSTELTERQIKAIPFFISSPTIEAGCKAAKISKNAFYEWMKIPLFKTELNRQRDFVVDEALDTLRNNMTKAVNTLVSLLASDSGHIKRYVANDIISHVLKYRELKGIEERLTAIEKLIAEKRGKSLANH
jgi:hypothetical protein